MQTFRILPTEAGKQASLSLLYYPTSLKMTFTETGTDASPPRQLQRCSCSTERISTAAQLCYSAASPKVKATCKLHSLDLHYRGSPRPSPECSRAGCEDHWLEIQYTCISREAVVQDSERKRAQAGAGGAAFICGRKIPKKSTIKAHFPSRCSSDGAVSSFVHHELDAVRML